jgi:hypothetical protein
VTGELLFVHSHIVASKVKIAKQVKEYFRELQQKYRRRFDEYVKHWSWERVNNRLIKYRKIQKACEMDVQRCASAWYQVPYTVKQETKRTKDADTVDGEELDYYDEEMDDLVMDDIMPGTSRGYTQLNEWADSEHISLFMQIHNCYYL